jgi:8-oxo-dGTP diphosphatase
MSYNYKYPRPSLTLDSVILRTLELKYPEILLIKRGQDPFKGLWALPGGFMDMDETPLAGAARELMEETGLVDLPLKPLFACGEPGRDPRGRTITMVFGCLVRDSEEPAKAGDDAAEAEWFSLHDIPETAFDHRRVIKQIETHLLWQAKTAIVGRDVFHGIASKKDVYRLHHNLLGKEMPPSADFFAANQRKGLVHIKEGLCEYLQISGGGPDWNPVVW